MDVFPSLTSGVVESTPLPIAVRSTVDPCSRDSDADRIHSQTDESFCRLEEVFIGLPVVARTARLLEVGADVVDGCLQPVQQVVEATQVGCRHDALITGHVQCVSPSTSLIGPLTVRGTTEASGAPDT